MLHIIIIESVYSMFTPTTHTFNISWLLKWIWYGLESCAFSSTLDLNSKSWVKTFHHIIKYGWTENIFHNSNGSGWEKNDENTETKLKGVWDDIILCAHILSLDFIETNLEVHRKCKVTLRVTAKAGSERLKSVCDEDIHFNGLESLLCKYREEIMNLN